MWQDWIGTLVTLVGAGILAAAIVLIVADRARAEGAEEATRRKKSREIMVAVGVIVVAAGVALM